jgi:hypothetical protein
MSSCLYTTQGELDCTKPIIEQLRIYATPDVPQGVATSNIKLDISL